VRMPDIPSPKSVAYQVWADKLTAFLKFLVREIEAPGPKIIQLEHKRENVSAASDGLLMYEPVSGTVVVSKGGHWYPLTAGATPVTTGIINSMGEPGGFTNPHH
jgi:hypothetical protein